MYETYRHDTLMNIASKIMDSVTVGNGGSINMLGMHPTGGYMVGGKSWTLTARPPQFDSYTVMDFLAAHTPVLTWGTVYVGWWWNGGRIFLDISDNVKEFIPAYDLGQRRKELAIWDVLRETEITL